MLTKKNSSKAQRRAVALQQLMSKNRKSKPTPKRRVKQRRRNPQARPGQIVNKQNNYAMCRLKPFSGMGDLTGIPDGANGRRILIDHRLRTNITFGPNGSATLVIAPCVPSPLWVLATDAGMIINSQLYPDSNPSAHFIPVPLSEWAGSALTYFANSGQINSAAPLYGSGKFRIVTCGWNLQYVGTTLTDSGLITINSAGLSIDPPNRNVDTFTVFSSQSGTATNFSSDEILVSIVNAQGTSGWLTTPSSITLSDQTITSPLKFGANGVLRHSDPDYKVCDLHNSQNYLILNGGTESLLMQRTPTPSFIQNSACISGYDAGWDATSIFINGGTSGQTFFIDIVLCIEYYPEPSTSMYALAKQGPSPSVGLMQSVEQKAKSMPLAAIGSVLSTAVKIGATML